MVSSPTNLIFACSVALASLLPTGSAYGQNVSTYSASKPGYTSNVIIDHSSMSPDSWSAPATVSTPVASVATNTLPQSGARGAGAIVPYQPSNIPFNATGFPQNNASPSIPNLNATSTRQSTNQIKSLIRQPGIDATNSVLTAPNNFSQSPIQQTTSRMGGQAGLSLTGPDQSALSNTSLPAFGNQPALPQNMSSATGKFDIQPAINSAIPNNLPAANSSVMPVTTPSAATALPAYNRAPFQAPGRYPLGINSGLSTTTPASQVMPGSSPATSYEALTNGAGTPISPSSYPSVGASGPANSQPLFQQPSLPSSPVFRPDLGHRAPNPTFRGRDHDSGLKMDFEDKKKEFPGLGETLATGRYFGSVGIEFLEANFQNNSAITQFNSSPDRASFVSSESFDFDFETAPRLRLGFESKLGPGVELDYFQYDQNSDVTSFTSNGLNSGQLSSGLFGPSSLTTLEAVNAGETLAATAGIDLETFSVSFFKEIKFPISRLNGMFGFQYASIFQTLEGRLTDAGGNVIGSLRSSSDLRAYGPKFRLEYYRPIGHTKLEFITKVGGGVLFGNRDQIVSNSGLPAVNRFSSNELAVTGDFYGGVQYKQNTAENRAYYVRLGVTHQTWIGGGTAVDAQETFGLRGFAFEVGYNR